MFGGHTKTSNSCLTFLYFSIKYLKKPQIYRKTFLETVETRILASLFRSWDFTKSKGALKACFVKRKRFKFFYKRCRSNELQLSERFSASNSLNVNMMMIYTSNLGTLNIYAGCNKEDAEMMKRNQHNKIKNLVKNIR